MHCIKACKGNTATDVTWRWMAEWGFALGWFHFFPTLLTHNETGKINSVCLPATSSERFLAEVMGPSFRRSSGLLRRSVTFCFSRERSFRLGSEADETQSGKDEEWGSFRLERGNTSFEIKWSFPFNETMFRCAENMWFCYQTHSSHFSNSMERARQC